MSKVLSSWIKSIKPVRATVVCFPPAGAGTGYFRQVASGITGLVEVYSVCLPGREARSREKISLNFAETIVAITSAISENLQGSLRFCGHSLGALLAFETAVRLERMGRKVDLLVISGKRVPQGPESSSSTVVSDEVLLQHIRAGGVDEMFLRDEMWLKGQLTLIRKDLSLFSSYSYARGTVVECPIVACASDEDSFIDSHEMLQWKNLTTSSFGIETLSGDHHRLYEQPKSVAKIVEILEDL